MLCFANFVSEDHLVQQCIPADRGNRRRRGGIAAVRDWFARDCGGGGGDGGGGCGGGRTRLGVRLFHPVGRRDDAVRGCGGFVFSFCAAVSRYLGTAASDARNIFVPPAAPRATERAALAGCVVNLRLIDTATAQATGVQTREQRPARLEENMVLYIYIY